MNLSMQMTMRRTLSILFSAAILMISCQKGAVGPQGAQGAQGPAGPQGPSGAANEKTYQFTAQSSDWFATSGSPGTWNYTAEIPALTQGIIDTGGVYVYWTQSDITGFPAPGLPAALQVQVTMAGAYATVSPSNVVPINFKVIIDP